MKKIISIEEKYKLGGRAIKYKDADGYIQTGRVYGTYLKFPGVTNGLERFEITWELARQAVENGVVIHA